LTATALSIVRWSDDYHLFILATLSLVAAYVAGEHAECAGLNGLNGTFPPVADSVLRGKRKEPATMEGASATSLLATSEHNRDTNHPLRNAEASGAILSFKTKGSPQTGPPGAAPTPRRRALSCILFRRPVGTTPEPAGESNDLNVLSKYQKGFEITGAVTLIASGTSGFHR
jgi:hypothetical protein